MPPESDSMSTNDVNDAQEPKGENRDKGEDVPASEDHFPKERTARDLSIRIALRQAGYDVSKLKNGAELDDAAKELLKAKTTRKRVVMRSWPRDPKGKYITPDNSQPGKTTSNGVQLWGATLFDFFRVRRIPDLPSLSTLTTGSKLAAWMKKHGEEKYAVDEMAWTEIEENPREVPPCDIAGLIEPTDDYITSGLWGKSMSSKNVKATNEAEKKGAIKKESNTKEGEPNKEGGETDKKKKKKKKKKKIKKDKGKEKDKATLFDASSYPTPWPLIPFSYSAPTLQNYIPLDRLPKKLIVHDPWNLLSAKDYEPEDQSEDDSGREDNSEPEDRSEPEEDPAPQKKRKIGDWTATPDITHVYELKLSPEATERLEAEATKTAKKKAELEKDLGGPYAECQGFLIRPIKQEPGPIEPPVYVVLPPEPPREPAEEAHLYISPAHSAGRGNHSIVYSAEWEVQRSMLMPYKLCRECVMKDVEEILKEEDGEDGSKKEARWKEKSAQLKRVWHVEPAVTASLASRDDEAKPKDIDEDGEIYNIRPGESYFRMEFEGPVRPIETRVPWLSPDTPYTMVCSHRFSRQAYPPTTKVKVMAKLSIQHDRHLAVEARNYQKFPKHMFEHWNGLNLLPPLHDPTPVGAVVPQFYGLYLPVESEDNIEHPATSTDSDSDVRMASPSPKPKPYLSPIMLLEDCGVPLNPQDLNIDEKNECASLYYRFHHAGWSHGSIAQRNILVQRGPLTLPPFYRCAQTLAMGEEEHSFRLIDFGRSTPMVNGIEGSREEMEVANLFGHMGY